MVGMNRLRVTRLFFLHTLRIQHVCDGQTQQKGAVFQNLDDVFDVQMSSSSLQITQNNTNANKILARAQTDAFYPTQTRRSRRRRNLNVQH